jgi:hypothetical protein
MSQYVETPTRAFTAGAAIAQFLRVKLSAGKLAAAGASDISLGVLQEAALADLDIRAVRLRTAQGTTKMVASEAISAGASVYAAASGKIAATGTVYEGIALEAAGADGDVIEVLPLPNVDVSATITGTNAATFEADADLGKPRTALGSQTGGTGDFKAVIRPPSTLTADRVFTLEGDAAATLVNKAGAQTLSDKTLTSPVITQPGSTFPVYIPHGPHTTVVAPAGAVPITNYYSMLNSTAGATTATLADGAVKGQLKKIQLIVDGGDCVLTPANLAGGTIITFADAGDFCVLVFDGTDWVAIELGNDADGATAPVLS